MALAQTGHTVTVIDALAENARKDTAFDGRAYALALASQRLLDAIGVWDRVAQHAQPMLEIKVTDGLAGGGPSPFFMHFDHAEIEEGPMGYMVEDRHLRRAFLDAMTEQDGVTQVSGKTVVAQSADETGVTLTLDDGSQITGSLLVGCDGRRSGTAARGRHQTHRVGLWPGPRLCVPLNTICHIMASRISSSCPLARWPFCLRRDT